MTQFFDTYDENVFDDRDDYMMEEDYGSSVGYECDICFMGPTKHYFNDLGQEMLVCFSCWNAKIVQSEEDGGKSDFGTR